MSTRHCRVLIHIIFSVLFIGIGYKYGLQYGLVAFIGLFLFYTLVGCYLSWSYIKSRIDLKDKNGKLVITENWNEKFLVAVVEIEKKEKVVGTVCYKLHDSVTFQGQKRGKAIELFSVSVTPEARGLGISKKLCNKVEEIAIKNKCDLYLGKFSTYAATLSPPTHYSETSMAQYPAINLYKKLGYVEDTIPFRKSLTGNLIFHFIVTLLGYHFVCCYKQLRK